MDEQLQRIIAMLLRQNETLGKARFDYLDMEAERKHFEGNAIKSAGGMNISHAQATTWAQSTKEWLDFHKKLARLEAIFEFEKLKFEVLSKEFLAIHLSLKLDHETLKKG